MRPGAAELRGFAKMGHRWMGKTIKGNCVRGSQGSPQGFGAQCGPAVTPGSSMNRRAFAPAASGSVLSRSVFSGAAFWIALFAALAVFGPAAVVLRAESANTFFKRGEAAEARQDYDAAFDNFQKAYAKDPKDLRNRAALYRVRATAGAMHMTKGRKLLGAGDEQGALTEFLHAAEIDPGNEAAQQEIAKIRKKHGEATVNSETSITEATGNQQEIESMGAPATLKPVSNEPLTLHMSEDAKVIYQAVGRAAGINILFDPDYTSKRVQVDLSNVSLLDALRIVGTMSNTFWRPVTDNTIFVAQNTRAKRTELDEQAVQTFYLTNAWQQNDLTDVQTAIRNVLPNTKVYGVPSQNAIVMRATPDELMLAQKLVNDLDKARPEVVVDIAVLEVSKNWQKTLGIEWPSSVSVALQSPSSSTSSSSSSTSSTTSPTLYNLSHLKASDFAVTVGSATLNLLLTDSNTKILDNPRIRCTDQQKATMKIGKKIPIATGSYQTGAATSSVSSLVNTQFQYQDVGINIEMTPTIHFDHDVTLKVKIEDTSEDGSSTISGVTEPIIAQKTSEQVIRLREGEASVLSGMMNKTDIISWTGVPGLSSIPGLKYLFGSKDHQIQEDEIVFVLIPHIVRSQSLDAVNLRTIDTGVGTSVELRHVPAEGTGVAPVPAAPPVRPQSSVRPGIGVVPGQSAQAAAPAAIAELRTAAEPNGNVPERAARQQPAQLAAKMSLALTPQPGPVAVGATFKVPVMLSGATDITSVPMQIQYDPAKLSLVNVDSGDFLGRDGQAVALVHRDDGPGSITINASRPPGASGVSGIGVVCVLSFQAKTAGESALVITRPAPDLSSPQQLPPGLRVSIVAQ
jgi:general secretion pathway protein D